MAGLGRWAAVGTRTQKWLATLLTGVSGVAAVAIAGLFIEHLFIEGWDRSARFWTFLGWLVASLAAWVLVFEWRTFLGRTAGSLYHVRLVPASMRNWHTEAQEAARGRFQRLLEVTRSVDLEPNRDGVADVRDDLGFAEDKLHDLFNSDDERTGFTLAPDVMWPLSFGLGSRLTLPPGTRFHDFGDQGSDGFEWPVDSVPGSGFLEVSSTRIAGTGSSGTHVHAALTGKPEYAPLPFGVRGHVLVGSLRDGAPVESRVGTVPSKGLVHPAAAVKCWVDAVHRALHDSVDQPVVITARAPKAVALAAGYAFVAAHKRDASPRSTDPGCGDEDCGRPACRRPWRYFLPLTYNQQAGAWYPVRLLREQRDPREFLRDLGVS